MIYIGNINTSSFRTRLTERARQFIKTEGLDTVANVVIDKTISTTTQGINPYTYPSGFSTYSTRYAKWKLKKTGSNSPVNLVLFNSMLASLFLKKNSNGFSGLVTVDDSVGTDSTITNRQKAIANANIKDRRFLEPNETFRAIMVTDSVKEVNPKLIAFLKQ